MGNISPRQSKSYHDGLNNHLSLSAATTSTSTTPNRSSWKKQLQLINETLNIKKFPLIHHHGRNKRYRTTLDENHPPRKLSTSITTQNFQEMIVHHADNGSKDERSSKTLSQEYQQRKTSFKKSFSLFAIKQPLADSTNKRCLSKLPHNPTHIIEDQVALNSQLKHSDQPSENHDVHQHKRRQKIEITTVSNTLINKRHSAFLPPSCQLSKSQSQYSHQQPPHPSQLSSHTKLGKSFSSSSKHLRTIDKSTSRKTIIQASTSELLRCLGEYLCSSCSHLLPVLNPMDCILWIKGADRQLVLQGWQEQVFVNPANIVFVYLLLRDTLTYVVPSTTIKSVTELHAIILTCLYLAFSYMGNEITYPLKPFVTENETRDVFWQRVVLIMGQMSSKMLAINQNPKFFTECFSELKTYNLVH